MATPLSSDEASPVSAARFLRVWFALGLQSFGGGVATLTLIRRAMVEQRRWVSDGDFDRDWALCQVAPGINLVCLTILLGRRVAGGGGIAMALLGLLFPSVVLTVLITAAYLRIHGNPYVAAGVRGVIPASVGLGLYTAYKMAAKPLQDSRRAGRPDLLVALGILFGSVLAVGLANAPVPFVLAGAGAVGAIFAAAKAVAR